MVLGQAAALASDVARAVWNCCDTDCAAFPANDLATSPHSQALLDAGAFRADVSGAGPTVYGLFHRRGDARRAAAAVKALGRVLITIPAWYG